MATFEPWHDPCRHIATGGLHCPDLKQRHQALFGLGRCSLFALVAYFGQYLKSGRATCRRGRQMRAIKGRVREMAAESASDPGAAKTPVFCRRNNLQRRQAFTPPSHHVLNSLGSRYGA
jgi:hypothetical protein